MNNRENTVRAYRFQNPEKIPVAIYPSVASWLEYRKDLEEIILKHKVMFPDFQKGSIDFARPFAIIFSP